MSRATRSLRRRSQRRNRPALAGNACYFRPTVEHLEQRRLLAVNLAPVNNLPTELQEATEAIPFAFIAARQNQISISDADAGTDPLELTLDVPFVSAKPAGVLTLVNRNQVPSGQLEFLIGDGFRDTTVKIRGSQANINLALSWVSFIPTDAAVGGVAGIDVFTNDLGNNGSGGPQFDFDQIAVSVLPAGVSFPESPAWTTTPSVLDTSFDVDGVRASGETGVLDYIDQMQLLPDGRIVAAGIAGDEVALFRFNTNLVLDTTFGNAGILKTGIADTTLPGTVLEVEEDSVGCYLVGGGSRLFKYFPDGSLDTSFGQGGTGFVDFGRQMGFWDLDFQADGTILLVNDDGLQRLSGDGNNPVQLVPGNYRGVKALDNGIFFLVRDTFGVDGFDQAGTLIGSFGTNSAFASSLLELPDERFLVVGADDGGDILVSRHQPDGVLDTTFGNGGTTALGIAGRSSVGARATLQADGKILVTGQAADFTNDDFIFVARLSYDGVPDGTFNGGTQSFVSVGIPPAGDDLGYDVVSLPDGRILAAGLANNDVGMLRLKGDWNPPLIDGVALQTANEDQGATTINLTGISSGLGDAQDVSLTAVPKDNLFSSLTITHSGNDPAGTLNYTTLNNANGATVVTIFVDDGGLDSDLATLEDNSLAQISFNLVVNPVNDAPVLDNTGGANFPTISEEDTDNNGELVSTLLASSVSDVDAGAVEGIALTGVTGSNGSWQVSGDDGSTWSPLGTVSNTSARLLLPNDRLRYVPDGLNGDTGSVTYQAWDQTSGSPGFNVDVSTNGGTTAFSTETDTATIAVASVNDAPVLATTGGSNFTTISEDDTANNGELVSTLVGSSISDVDAGAVEGIAVTGLTGSDDTWQFSGDNGSTWTDVGTVSITSALLLLSTDRLRYVPDGENADAGSVTYQAWDQTSGSAGNKVDVSNSGAATAFSTAAGTANLTVTAVNDAPVNTVPGSQSVNEEGNLVFSTGGGNTISVSDVDVGANDLQVNLSTTDAVLTLSGMTGLTVSGNGSASLTASGSMADLNTALNGLTYSPNLDFNGSSTLTIGTSDQGNSGSGGALSDTDNVAITVTSVNDVPSFTSGGDVTVLEDAGSQTVAGWATAISGGPANEAGQVLSFQVTGNTNAALFNGNVTVDAGSGDLTFTPADDANGTADITLVLADDGGVANGGVDTSGSQTFRITVTSVNDVPVSSNGFYQPTENTTLTVATATGLATLVVDIDSSSLTHSVVQKPTFGALVLNTDGSFTYTPDTNFNRTDFFTYRVDDGDLVSNISTVTLQVATAFPWHNGIMPLDVNDDGQANTSDVLLLIELLNTEGSHVLPVPRSRPLVPPFKDTNRDGVFSELDILRMVQRINQTQQPVMRIRIAPIDSSGAILDQVIVGESFFLASYVMDLQASGVFAAYFDIDYQAGLVAITAVPDFTAPYQSVTQFASLVTGSVEVIDEVGAASNSVDLAGGEREFFKIPMVATATGIVNFVANETDQPIPQAARDLAISLGLIVSDVPNGKINYGSYQLAILPDPSGGEPEGEAVALAFQLDSVLRPPLASTLPARLSLSGWTIPGRGEPVVYQQGVDDAMRTQGWQSQPLLARSDDRQYDMQEDADELTDLVDQLAADEDRWDQY